MQTTQPENNEPERSDESASLGESGVNPEPFRAQEVDLDPRLKRIDAALNFCAPVEGDNPFRHLPGTLSQTLKTAAAMILWRDVYDS